MTENEQHSAGPSEPEQNATPAPHHPSPYTTSWTSSPYAYGPTSGYLPPGYAPAGVQQPGPAPAARRSRGRRALMGVAGVGLAAALVASGVGIGNAFGSNSGTVASSAVTGNGTSGTGSSGTSGSTGSSGSSSGSSAGSGGTSTSGGLGDGTGTFPGGSSGSTGSTGTQTSGTTATATQQVGIVTVVSVLKYENAESAGTGMILTANGEILTNNHVVDGATSVTVTVESTGKSYKATVVGTDPTDDVAVLQLTGASGLATARIGDSTGVAVGDSVTGVGNAGGTGTLTSVTGAVTALDKSITASDEDGSSSEQLTGLIQTNADVVAGDSGGPLYDSSGEIIGIDTAASSSNSATSSGAAATSAATSESFAIPIDNALKIADQIESGVETSTIHIGLPAFLGVGISATTTTSGAGVESVLSGGSAADAGITAGSVITAIGGKSVTSASSLTTRMAAYEPGQKVKVTWTDTSGASHTATVTLGTGPAD